MIWLFHCLINALISNPISLQKAARAVQRKKAGQEEQEELLGRRGGVLSAGRQAAQDGRRREFRECRRRRVTKGLQVPQQEEEERRRRQVRGALGRVCVIRTEVGTDQDLKDQISRPRSLMGSLQKT